MEWKFQIASPVPIHHVYSYVNLKHFKFMLQNIHFTHSASWYSSVNKLLKIVNIQDNSMWYNKSKFGFILRKCLNQKYLSDWKDTSESLKGWKTYHIFIFKDQF